jgi:amidophosphoribosyltransferase
VRYPTIGGNRGDDAQPFHLTYPVGIAMAHNGNVSNYAELVDGFFRGNRTRLNSSCDLEVILFVFAKALDERLRERHATKIEPDDIFHAVSSVYDLVKGAYSVVATLPDVGMVAFRDPYGIKPIIFGQKTTEEGDWFACASESVVLDINGYTKTHDIGPGEAIFIDSTWRSSRTRTTAPASSSGCTSRAPTRCSTTSRSTRRAHASVRRWRSSGERPERRSLMP